MRKTRLKKQRKKPPASFGKVQQVYDGVPERYWKRRNGAAVLFTVCCDCGLVHLEELTPRGRYIKARVWRDDKRTGEMRKRKRVRLVRG